jgi:hypothetical protein
MSPTSTLSPEQLARFETPATQAVTPTYITAEAPIVDLGIITPVPGTATPQVQPPTPTPRVFPTVALQVTIPPTLAFAPQAPTLIPLNTQTMAFAISTVGGVSTSRFNLLGDTTLFERNPANPAEFATTDSSGLLYLTGVNGSGAARIDVSPFSEFIPQSRDENNAYVAAIAWSPNGQYLAFIVNGDKLANDGVWFFTPGAFPPNQLLVDCPNPGFPGCAIVNNGSDPDTWESRSLAWSPGSDTILVGAWLSGESRAGLVIVPVSRNERARDTRPPVFRYQYGIWENGGGRVLVSGASPDGHVFVGFINRDGSFSELVYDAEANGLWMGFANQARDGSVYALGAPGGRGGPAEALRIYAMNGQALTGAIGDGFPQRVEWSPDGSAALVVVNGRQYVARINGEVSEITGQASGARAVNWVSGGLPPSAESGGGVLVPTVSGVIAGSRYEPGQQLQVYSAELNIRTGPGTGYGFARVFLSTGEYVRVLAGPVEAEGFTWWQVQTADGVVGWVAGTIGGLDTLGPG